MRSNSRTALALGAIGLILATAGAFARQAPSRQPQAVIGSHQIDRFEAIRILQRSLKGNPDAVGDWVILGELAHEAALDLPSGQDNNYYRLSREAYEKALALDPENAGLTAAVQFAQDQEGGAEQFDQARKRAASTYIQARRREMAQTNNAPTVQVYNTPPPQGQPADADPDPTQPINQDQTQAYPTQTYRPFVAPATRPGQAPNPSQARPYTYQQYQNQYLPPAGANSPQAQPMTLRQLGQQLPNAFLQDISGAAKGR